jgi:hypothetical protein
VGVYGYPFNFTLAETIDSKYGNAIELVKETINVPVAGCNGKKFTERCATLRQNSQDLHKNANASLRLCRWGFNNGS